MLLALDTSTHTASLALYDERGIVGETTWRPRENHTRQLMPELVQLLGLVGSTAQDVRAIGVATGPGSFTGLRIGLSAAKGLAFSTNAALIGIPTLDVAASVYAAQPLPVCAVMQAGRTRYGAAFYRTGAGRVERVGDYFFGTAEALAARLESDLDNSTVLLTGELDMPLREVIAARWGKRISFSDAGMDVRRAGWLAALAWERWRAGQVDDLQTLAPYYIPTTSLA